MYENALRMLEFCEEKGLDPTICIHSKHTSGCPGCNARWLRYFKITPLRWNPEAWKGTPDGIARA